MDSFNDLSVSASNIMLSLKSDQESFDKRFEVQERQYNIMMSSLAEEMAAAKTTIEKMKEEQEEEEESNNEISELFDDIQQHLATLISNSQNYGKLRVRSKDKKKYLYSFQYLNSMRRVCPRNSTS